LWMAYSDISSGPESIEIHDLWEMRDGHRVTITNRPEDLPAWFSLHPTEVSDALAYKMIAKIENGYTPGEPMDGSNVWRLKSGDRVAWVGAHRPERRSVNGVLAILDCQECALAVGEGNSHGVNALVGFGGPTKPKMKPEDVTRCQAAVKAVKQLGPPRAWASKWRLR
jgi:hypothetical protein